MKVYSFIFKLNQKNRRTSYAYKRSRENISLVTISQDRYKRDWIKTYIPVTISFIALLKSFDTEIIWLWKQLMQLLK